MAQIGSNAGFLIWPRPSPAQSTKVLARPRPNGQNLKMAQGPAQAQWGLAQSGPGPKNFGPNPSLSSKSQSLQYWAMGLYFCWYAKARPMKYFYKFVELTAWRSFRIFFQYALIRHESIFCTKNNVGFKSFERFYDTRRFVKYQNIKSVCEHDYWVRNATFDFCQFLSH